VGEEVTTPSLVGGKRIQNQLPQRGGNFTHEQYRKVEKTFLLTKKGGKREDLKKGKACSWGEDGSN